MANNMLKITLGTVYIIKLILNDLPILKLEMNKDYNVMKNLFTPRLYIIL